MALEYPYKVSFDFSNVWVIVFWNEAHFAWKYLHHLLRDFILLCCGVNLTRILRCWSLAIFPETGHQCYPARAAYGDGQDEALSAEPINKDSTLQTNQVSQNWLFRLLCDWKFVVPNLFYHTRSQLLSSRIMIKNLCGAGTDSSTELTWTGILVVLNTNETILTVNALEEDNLEY